MRKKYSKKRINFRERPAVFWNFALPDFPGEIDSDLNLDYGDSQEIGEVEYFFLVTGDKRNRWHFGKGVEKVLRRYGSISEPITISQGSVGTSRLSYGCWKFVSSTEPNKLGAVIFNLAANAGIHQVRLDRELYNRNTEGFLEQYVVDKMVSPQKR